MVNCNKKERKRLRGFPAQCAGFLLALFMLCTPFNAFAFDKSTAFTEYVTSDLPSINSLYNTYVVSEGATITGRPYNMWLFVDNNTEPYTYYLIFTRSFDVAEHGSNSTYQIYYRGQQICTSWYDGSTQFGFLPANYSGGYNWCAQCLRCYRYQNGTYNDWTLFTSGKCFYDSFYSGRYIQSAFDTNGLILLANSINQYVDDVKGYYYSDLSNNISFEVTEFLQCGFEPTANGGCDITNVYEDQEPEPEPEPEYNGLLGTIINWLTQIKNGITDFFTNFSTYLSNGISVIQGWLTSLGSTIGGFFTNLWSNLSTAFTNIGTWFSTLWSNISSGLSSLGDRISNFFVGLVNDIKGLFIPDDDFWTDYKADVEDAMSENFGALYQSIEVTGDLLESIGDLFDYERPDDLDISFPRLRFAMRVNSSSITHRVELFDVSNSNTAVQYVDSFNNITSVFQDRFSYQKFGGGTGYIYIMDLWDGFVTASFALYLFYFLKNQLNRILSNSFNVGGE